MQPFPFTKVLGYRRHVRQECRQELASVLAEERSLVGHRSSLDQKRQDQLTELGQMAESNQLSVEAAARRRYFAGQLEVEMLIVDEQITRLRIEVEKRRAALIQADKDVQALERLEEKHVAKEEYEGRRRSEVELSDKWQAGQLAVNSKR